VSIVLKSGSLKLLEPSGPVQASNGIALPLTVYWGIFKVYPNLNRPSYKMLVRAGCTILGFPGYEIHTVFLKIMAACDIVEWYHG